MTTFSETYKMGSMRLFKYRNGVWYVSMRYGHSKSLKTRDADTARRIFRRLKREVAMGHVISLDAVRSIRLSAFRTEYLAWADSVKASASVRSDSLALRTLEEYLGDRYLKAITTRLLDQDFHRAVLGRGASVATVNTYIRRCRAAFNKAVEWGYLEKNPYARGERRSVLLPEEERQPRYLAVDEMQRLMRTIEAGGRCADRDLPADPEFARMIRVYLLSGCRRSELVQMRWADVNASGGYVLIPKTKTRRQRILYLSAQLSALMTEIKQTAGASARAKAASRRPSPWVFPRWRSPDAVSRLFHRYVEAAGIPPCRLHDLRHTAASYLAMADVPMETIARLLGHTDARTTQIYAHLSPAYQAGVMDKLSEALGDGLNPKVTSITRRRR